MRSVFTVPASEHQHANGVPSAAGLAELTKQNLPLIGFLILICLAAWFGSSDMRAVKAISGAELVNTQEHLENVTLTGRVLARKPAKGDIGTVLTLEAVDGFEFSAYISPDVGNVQLHTGEKVQVSGSSIAPGVLQVTNKKGLKKLKQITEPQLIQEVEVLNNVASWQNGNTVVTAPCTLANGNYKELHMTIDAKGRREISR